jgi:hypothetical protein
MLIMPSLFSIVITLFTYRPCVITRHSSLFVVIVNELTWCKSIFILFWNINTHLQCPPIYGRLEAL